MTGESQFRHSRPGFAGQGIVKVLFPETGGSENRHARTDEMKRPQSLYIVEGDPQKLGQLFEARMGACQDPALVDVGAAFSPKGPAGAA